MKYNLTVPLYHCISEEAKKKLRLMMPPSWEPPHINKLDEIPADIAKEMVTHSSHNEVRNETV